MGSIQFHFFLIAFSTAKLKKQWQ